MIMLFNCVPLKKYQKYYFWDERKSIFVKNNDRLDIPFSLGNEGFPVLVGGVEIGEQISKILEVNFYRCKIFSRLDCIEK